MLTLEGIRLLNVKSPSLLHGILKSENISLKISKWFEYAYFCIIFFCSDSTLWKILSILWQQSVEHEVLEEDVTCWVSLMEHWKHSEHWICWVTRIICIIISFLDRGGVYWIPFLFPSRHFKLFCCLIMLMHKFNRWYQIE